MILAIVGSRDYPLPDLVRRYVSRIPPGAVSALYSGGARGVDTWAAEAARFAGIQVIELLADWDRYGKRAGLVRNQELVDAVDQVVAFWDGASRGTRHTIGIAFEAGKLRRVFGVDGKEIRWPWTTSSGPSASTACPCATAGAGPRPRRG